MMPCELMNACYSICAAFFQTRFQARQSFADGSDSHALFPNCHQRFAGDGFESGEAFSELSSRVESRFMESVSRFEDSLKCAD